MKKTIQLLCVLLLVLGIIDFACKKENSISPTAITLSKDSLTLTISSKDSVSATISPANVTNNSVTWKSSNSSVASVSSTGVITAIGVGNSTIIAVTNDGKFIATCFVKVIIPTTGITLSKINMTIGVGKNDTIIATISPSNATSKDLSWKSSNTGIATINPCGIVTGISPGTDTITITSKQGNFKANCVVTVIIPTTGITLSKTNITLGIPNTYILSATVSPSNATNKIFTWRSSDSSIATISSSGVITPISPGIDTIVVTTAQGNFKATCLVTVIVPTTGVTLSKSSVALSVLNTYTLTATVNPANASNKNVTWRSSNSSIAIVSSSGVVTGLSSGIDTIVVTTNQGNFKATCLVTVFIPTKNIRISKTSLNLNKGDSYMLTATVYPTDATDKTFTWRSSNSTIATVSSNGLVSAVSPGIDTIIVTTNQGNLKAKSIINVFSSEPVLYYPFNESVKDGSGNKNDGTYYGRGVYTSDRNSMANSAIELNGTSDYIEIPNSASLNPANQLTICMWMYIDSYPNRYTPVLSKGGPSTSGFTNREYLIYFNDQGGLYIESSGDNQPHNYVGALIPGLKTWFHFTAVVDRINHKMQVYINGVYITEVADSYSNLTINNYPVKIGSWNEVNGEYAPFFKGKIDEVWIYNRILSQAEITSIYQH